MNMGGGRGQRGWISSSDEHFYGHFCPLSPGLQSVERMGNDWVEGPIPGSCHFEINLDIFHSQCQLETGGEGEGTF